MKHVQKSVLLPYSAYEMYQLVTDVPAYPQFLPWCPKAEILQTFDDGVLARVHLAFAGVKNHFTTRNVHDPERAVRMSLHDGPFSVLNGGWQFSPIEKNGVSVGTRATFELNYRFSSLPLQLVLSPVFDKIVGTFVDCFTRRAQALYGRR